MNVRFRSKLPLKRATFAGVFLGKMIHREHDHHFIVKDLMEKIRISLLPVNKEKYLTFTVFDNETKISFRFIE